MPKVSPGSRMTGRRPLGRFYRQPIGQDAELLPHKLGRIVLLPAVGPIFLIQGSGGDGERPQVLARVPGPQGAQGRADGFQTGRDGFVLLQVQFDLRQALQAAGQSVVDVIPAGAVGLQKFLVFLLILQNQAVVAHSGEGVGSQLDALGGGFDGHFQIWQGNPSCSKAFMACYFTRKRGG